MTTPAGWYDDGSGRQRWWDGTQWTEHFAPAADAAPAVDPAPVIPAVPPVPPVPTVPPVSAVPSVPTVPPTPTAPDAQPTVPFEAPGATAATVPLTDGLPPYAAAAPAYPNAAPAYPSATPAYPSAAPAYPSGGAGYQGAAAVPAPAGMSVLGLIGLGVAVLGTIVACIPFVFVIGFIMLFAGFVMSIISLFLKGKKWPGIAGLIVSVLGTIIAIVVLIVTAAMAVSTIIESVPSSPPSATSPSEEPSGDPVTSEGRPTVDELAAGLTDILATVEGGEFFSAEDITCIAEQFIANTEMSDEVLQTLAQGADVALQDADATLAFSEHFATATIACTG